MKSRADWDAARIKLIEECARLDEDLDWSLALHFGRDAEHVLILSSNVIWRVPVDTKLDLLGEALERAELIDEVPVLVPALRSIFRTRNLLAHGATLEHTSTAARLRTVNRGKLSVVQLAAATLADAVRNAVACRYHFDRVEARIGSIEAWGRLYGFDDE